MGAREDAAEIVWPCLRDWSDPAEAAVRLRPAVEDGAGGFIVFGGEAAAVRDLAARLRVMRPAAPPILSADLERGAGQQFRGATEIPTPMAIAATRRPDLAERAGALTAAEARALGVSVVFAPVCDSNLDPENPIVNVRAFSDSPEVCARFAAAWVRGCERAGAAATPKHFPGHGRTAVDSHVSLAPIEADLDSLRAADFLPFRAAFGVGARCAMVAHVACEALGGAGVPATRSPEALRALRGLGFDGVAFTDAMIMGAAVRRPAARARAHGGTGARPGPDEAGTRPAEEGTAAMSGAETEACVEAVAAGCDVLLYPTDFATAAGAVAGRVAPTRLAEAAGRVRRLRETLAAPAAPVDDPGLADEIAAAAVTALDGPAVLPAEARVYVVTDDERADPAPFLDALRARGVSLVVERLRPGGAVPARPDDRASVVALYLFPRAWRGRAGLDAAGVLGVEAIARQGPTAVVSFGDPYSLARVRSAGARFAAYDGTAAMQRAAAAVLRGERARGSLPVSFEALESFPRP